MVFLVPNFNFFTGDDLYDIIFLTFVFCPFLFAGVQLLGALIRTVNCFMNKKDIGQLKIYWKLMGGLLLVFVILNVFGYLFRNVNNGTIITIYVIIMFSWCLSFWVIIFWYIFNVVFYKEPLNINKDDQLS